MFRAMQGIAVSLHLPTSMAILSTSVPSGQRRNIGMSCLGISQCIGFSVGLVLGGIFQETVGWRVGYYASGAIAVALFFVGTWSLPPDQTLSPPTQVSMLKRLVIEIDWVGVWLASTCLTLLAYVLA